MGTKSEKVGKLEKVIGAINKNKKYRGDKESNDVVVGLINEMAADVEKINSGSLVLDGILGGGFGKGRIVEIYGKPSSGKTSIAISTVANVQRTGGTAVYIDVENAFDPNYAKALGVNLDELFFSQPDSAEQALDLVADLTASRMVDLIVVDSVAALVPKAELEGDSSDVTVGALARLMSKQLRKLIKPASQSGTTVIFINQTRDKIGGFSPFGVPQETPGGQALKFYASQRIEIKKGQPVTGKNKDDVIGVEMKISNKKNKIAPPFKSGSTIITYAKGINRAAEMVTVAPDYGVIIKPNPRKYETFDGELIGNSRADAIEKLEQDSELFERLAEKLTEALVGATPEEETNEDTKEAKDADFIEEDLEDELQEELDED